MHSISNVTGEDAPSSFGREDDLRNLPHPFKECEYLLNVIGFKGVGKTTLVRRLLPSLSEQPENLLDVWLDFLSFRDHDVPTFFSALVNSLKQSLREKLGKADYDKADEAMAKRLEDKGKACVYKLDVCRLRIMNILSEIRNQGLTPCIVLDSLDCLAEQKHGKETMREIACMVGKPEIRGLILVSRSPFGLLCKRLGIDSSCTLRLYPVKPLTAEATKKMMSENRMGEYFSDDVEESRNNLESLMENTGGIPLLLNELAWQIREHNGVEAAFSESQFGLLSYHRELQESLKQESLDAPEHNAWVELQNYCYGFADDINRELLELLFSYGLALRTEPGGDYSSRRPLLSGFLTEYIQWECRESVVRNKLKEAELALRRIIEATFTGKYGVNWFPERFATLNDTWCGISHEVEELRKKERRRHGDCFSNNVTDYLYLKNLWEMISMHAHWLLFKNAFTDNDNGQMSTITKSEWHAKFNYLHDVRNSYAHFRGSFDDTVRHAIKIDCDRILRACEQQMALLDVAAQTDLMETR